MSLLSIIVGVAIDPIAPWVVGLIVGLVVVVLLIGGVFWAVDRLVADLENAERRR